MTNFVEEICYRCKEPFGMLRETRDIALRRREAFTFYCPHGHGQNYTTDESEADKLRRERDRLKQEMAYKDDLLRQAKEAAESAGRSADAYRGQVTRLKTRAKAGLCPCCNRHFENLHRHMSGKHPEFKAEEAA